VAKSGSSELLSFKMLWLIILTFVIFKGANLLELYACANTEWDCFWLEKAILLLAGTVWIFAVLKPFSVIFKLNSK
jgi:hypothetical protein